MPDLLTAKDRTDVAGLQLLAQQVVEGFCSGLHRSPHKGFSVEFKQHRQYVPGDELRHLDWRVFGKTDRFYVREYEEETNLRSTILLDCSGSMGYRGSATDSHSKLEYARRLAACFAYIMLGQQDSVGLATFDDRVRNVIPNRSRPSHLQVLVDEMERAETGGDSDLGGVFGKLAPKLHRRGMIVILSDCFSDTDSLLTGLAHLRHARHEIIIFQIWDRDELDFPFQRWSRFDCLEQTDFKQFVDPAHLRREYLQNLNRFRERLEQICHRNRIDLVPMVTDEPYSKALSMYLASRARKRRR